jgi:hypothetical protein
MRLGEIERKKRQHLQREISVIKEGREELRAEQHTNPNRQTEAALRELRPRLRYAERNLEQFESRLLVKEAIRRGIAISKEADWWTNDRVDYEGRGLEEQFINDMYTTWLSETGRAMVTRLIADDRKKNIEWWMKIVIPLLTIMISLMGLIVALVAVARK